MEAKETINGLIPFKLSGHIDSFQEEFAPILISEYSLNEMQARNLASSIWLFVNDEWRKGYYAAEAEIEKLNMK